MDLSQVNSTRADALISPGMVWSALALQNEPPERIIRGLESRTANVVFTILSYSI